MFTQHGVTVRPFLSFQLPLSFFPTVIIFLFQSPTGMNPIIAVYSTIPVPEHYLYYALLNGDEHIDVMTNLISFCS